MYELEQYTLCADLINEIFLDFLDNIENSAFIIIINGHIRYSNNHFLKLSGYTKSEIIGASFNKIIPEYLQEQTNKAIKQINYNKTDQYISIICANKEILLFRINGKFFPQEDVGLALIELTPFENNVKKTEKVDYDLYLSVLNSVSENIFIIDKELYIKQSLKIKSEKFSHINSLPELFTLNAIKQIKKIIDRKWLNNNSRFFELQNHKNYYEGRLTPYKDDCFVFAFSEISLRKRIENKLIDSQIQLRELNNEKDLLLSIIAHDLKNPFNIINGFCNILLNPEKNYPNNKKDEIIKHIYTASINGHNLLENLLEWSRSQSERIIFSPQDIALKDISNHIINFYSNNIVNKKLIIDNKITKDLNVFADKNMLSTILRNLISNAIKFTPEKGQIEINALKTKHNLIQVTVKDSGVGLTEKQISNLFLVGKNCSTQGTKGEKGSGLGLLLCKEFIEKHKGTIKVESSLGYGSVFIFTLPVAFNETITNN